MRFLTAVSLLSVALLATGCTQFFEREIELDELPFARSLVLQTILFPQDSFVRADVYVTAPAVGDPPADYPRGGLVTEARVTLNGPTGSFPLTFRALGGFNCYVLPVEGFTLEAGATYEVVAEWDGLTARGRTTIPELAIARDSIVLEDVSNDQERRVRPLWPNGPGEDDYYMLFRDQVYETQPDDVQRDIYDFIHGRDVLGPTLTGESFAGTSANGYELTINVCQITQATYDYLLTLEAIRNNNDNPFAEPTTVANNLEEGRGLVGASSCRRIVY
ncbi:DUF4249 family protein [Lewinella sp. IMCC34183]|uniref:DUF4249 family protein n=1 Tax=Lewinella sp. IMCC34183 TaxID=2248762 RepID=UPI000E233C15|nr:DUF4249 family protein [Lewinella sp. IMCC34183]